MRAKLQLNFDPGQDWYELRVYAGLPTARLYIPELEYDECKIKAQRCVSANRLSFSELFDDLWLVLNVRGLCVVVDNLISAAKVCHCVISVWC